MRFVVATTIGNGLTTDGWTGDQLLKFHSLTSHGFLRVGAEFIYTDLVLSTSAFPAGDAITVGNWIREKCREWGLAVDTADARFKIVGLAVDGAERAACVHAQLPSWHCTGHVINLAVHDVLEPKGSADTEQASYFCGNVYDLIRKCSQSVVSYFGSPLRKSKLEELNRLEFAKDERISFAHNVSTRWSSEFSELFSVFRRKELLIRYWLRNANDLPRDYDKLDAADWALLEDVLFILSHAREITEAVQGSSYPSASFLWPFLFESIYFLHFECSDEKLKTAAGREFRNRLKERWCARLRDVLWDPQSSDICFASLGLSPWFWQKEDNGAGLFKFRFEGFYNALGLSDLLAPPSGPHLDGRLFRKRVEAKLVAVAGRVAPRRRSLCASGFFPVAEAARPQADEGHAAPQEALFKRVRLFSSAVPHPAASSDEFTDNLEAEASQFRDYLANFEDSTTSPVEAIGKLLFSKRFPRLCHTSLWLLSLPATNAPSESLWSDQGFISDGRRNRITVGHQQLQLCIRRNWNLIRFLRSKVRAAPGESLEVAYRRLSVTHH